MCQLTKLFRGYGFEVESVSKKYKKPLIIVRKIPRYWVLRKNLPEITQNYNGKTTTMRLGEHLGCRVALIVNEQLTLEHGAAQ